MTSRNKARRHSRAAIGRVLEGLVSRCREVQADDTSGMEVKLLAIFGSTTDPDRVDFGDLDVGMLTGVKPGRRWKEILNEAYGRGYQPWNPRTSHLDPHGALLRRIKARSAIISVHDLEEVLRLGCPYVVAYAAPSLLLPALPSLCPVSAPDSGHRGANLSLPVSSHLVAAL